MRGDGASGFDISTRPGRLAQLTGTMTSSRAQITVEPLLGVLFEDGEDTFPVRFIDPKRVGVAG